MPIFDSIVLSRLNILVVELDMSFVGVWDDEKGFTETCTSVLVFAGVVVALAAVNTVDTAVWDVTNGEDIFVVGLDTVVDTLDVLIVILSFSGADVEIRFGVFCVFDVEEATFTVDFDVLDDVVDPTVAIASCSVEFVVLGGVARVDIDVKDVVDITSLAVDVDFGVAVGDSDFIFFVDSVVAGM